MYFAPLCLAGLTFVLTMVITAHSCKAIDTITIDFGGTPTTVSINATNKAALTRRLTRENIRRSLLTPPLTALTLEQYMRDEILDKLKGLTIQVKGEDHIEACTKFKALTTAEQNNILTTLNNNNPCP